MYTLVLIDFGYFENIYGLFEFPIIILRLSVIEKCYIYLLILQLKQLYFNLNE